MENALVSLSNSAVTSPVGDDVGLSRRNVQTLLRSNRQAAQARRAVAATPAIRPAHRPSVRGPFIYVGEQKLQVRGVCYAPANGASGYPEPSQVAEDFARMRLAGINAVRVYSMPPGWFLDLASRHGLFVMCGLAWEQHIDFLADPARADEIERQIAAQVLPLVGHPAILCYVLANEIPASVVRWQNPRCLERYLRRLYTVVKGLDPDGLITYANYPSTQYLDLPFLDFLCFNVYLENPEELGKYLLSLEHGMEDRPLVLTELGLDTVRNGEEAQARMLATQIPVAEAAGCAGVFVFCWSDLWHRGGNLIEDWKFGLLRLDRTPRASLEVVKSAFSAPPVARRAAWPKVSVIVCTYNGQRTLRETLTGIESLQYPDFEVIVVDDGSTDRSAAIAAEFSDVRVIRTPNRGLSNARNTGLEAATGEIVAYIDDDACPDRHWLLHLVDTLLGSAHMGVGGPNLPCPDDSPVADCVSLAPGGPAHVMLSEQIAEHIPGCNMAFRKAALLATGGFDPQFCIAGDDVDICWRIQERGWTLAFSPGAVVWHHRRAQVKKYWSQQVNYGKAEALLERKWPHKYNTCGHVSWGGRLYANWRQSFAGAAQRRIFFGVWGQALFQPAHLRGPSFLAQLPTMPEWYLFLLACTLALPLIACYRPAAAGAGLAVVLALLLATPIARAIKTYRFLSFNPWRFTLRQRVGRAALVGWLHAIQPAARLWGRLSFGLTLWRSVGGKSSETLPVSSRISVPCTLHFARRQNLSLWVEKWEEHPARLERLQAVLRSYGAAVRPGGGFDRWDLDIRRGVFGWVRVFTCVEEHGNGRQLIRVKIQSGPTSAARFQLGCFFALGALTLAMHSLLPLAACALALAFVSFRILLDSSRAMGLCLHALQEPTTMGIPVAQRTDERSIGAMLVTSN